MSAVINDAMQELADRLEICIKPFGSSLRKIVLHLSNQDGAIIVVRASAHGMVSFWLKLPIQQHKFVYLTYDDGIVKITETDDIAIEQIEAAIKFLVRAQKGTVTFTIAQSFE